MAFPGTVDLKRIQQYKSQGTYPAQYTDYYRLRDQTLLKNGSSEDTNASSANEGASEKHVRQLTEEIKGDGKDDAKARLSDVVKEEEGVEKEEQEEEGMTGEKDKAGGLMVKMKNMLGRKKRDDAGGVGQTDGGDGIVR
ncbi:MAG: hypothetical protein M1836_005524 [Candelina mexicana]|nr:MAG: hypothetical protein M1836_005524 [Candelina mexicana]